MEVYLEDMNRDNHPDVLLLDDPPHRYKSRNLFVFNPESVSLISVPEFAQLGATYTIGNLFYSYITCGCADECWESILFRIDSTKIVNLARQGCDCYNFTVSVLLGQENKIVEIKKCPSFGFNAKHQSIESKWKGIISSYKIN